MMFNFKKSIQFKILAVSLLLWFGSCDNFLTPEPESFVAADNFFENPNEFESALAGAYNRLRNQAGLADTPFMFFSEIRFDMITRQFDVNLPSIQGQPIEEWFMVNTNDWIELQWNEIYNTISQANIILTRIDNIDFDSETQKNRIIGEAKFLRALSYWYAVQYWGGVPLVLEEIRTVEGTVPEGGRNTEEEIFAQIIQDLEEAIPVLPATTNQLGRATQGAATFLLGKTFLLTGDYSSAINRLEQAESDFGYRLLENYSEIFEPGNSDNDESIFVLNFSNSVADQPDADIIRRIMPINAETGDLVPVNVDQGNAGKGWYFPSRDAIEMFEFEAGSDRYDANILWWENPGNSDFPDVAVRGDSIPIIEKFYFPDQIDEQGEQDGDIILFRYADVLLSLAEAYWKSDPSANESRILSLLNRIRERAGAEDVDLSNIPLPRELQGTPLASDPLGRAIFIERSVELFAEGHRMFDLNRFGLDIAVPIMENYATRRKEFESRVSGTLIIEPFKFKLPIPSQEINFSDLEQNPGWR